MGAVRAVVFLGVTQDTVGVVKVGPGTVVVIATRTVGAIGTNRTRSSTDGNAADC
jgi:hypothetical protein